jgi:cysteine desulfuration protein SufE
MSLAEKQQRLIAKYAIIEDAQERLAAIVSRGKKWPAVANEDKTEAHRVKGCVSQVWIVGAREGDRCRFRMDADSPLVKGLVAVLCELYDGETAEEIVSTEPEWIEALGLENRLSPTRLNGLASVRGAIRAFAAAHAPA